MEDILKLEGLMQAMKVDGKLIAFEYTLSIGDGEIIDSNVGQTPMFFQTGVDEMLPDLEEALIRMEVGERKQVFIPPERAYGPITEKAHRVFPLASIPEKARRLGHKVMSRTPDGAERMVEVIALRDDKVVLDFNHPLAGQSLHFDVTVITSEQLSGG